MAEEKRYVKKSVTEMIDVNLTQEERDERAKLASKLHGDLVSQESELKEETEYAKGKINKTKTAMAAAAQAHNSGKEYQRVKATQVFDLETSKTWFEFRDEKYSERRMYESEIADCQKNLFGQRPIVDTNSAFDIEAGALAQSGRYVSLKVWKKWTTHEKAEALRWSTKMIEAKNDPKKKAPAKIPLHVEALPTEAPKPKTSEELAKDAAAPATLPPELARASTKKPPKLSAVAEEHKPVLVVPEGLEHDDPMNDLGYEKGKHP